MSHVRTYARTYVRTYVRTNVRTYVRTYVGICHHQPERRLAVRSIGDGDQWFKPPRRDDLVLQFHVSGDVHAA